MAEGVTVEFTNFKQICKKLNALNKESEVAIKRTVSDFKSRGPGWVQKAVREDYSISVADVKDSLKAKTSRGSIKIGKGIKVDNVGIIYRGKTLTPLHYKMGPTAPKDNKGKPIAAPGDGFDTGSDVVTIEPVKPYKIKMTVRKGRRVEITGKPGYSKPFLASMNGSPILPFQRSLADSKKIISVRSTSVPQMITNDNVAKVINKNINEGMSARLEHHLERLKK